MNSNSLRWIIENEMANDLRRLQGLSTIVPAFVENEITEQTEIYWTEVPNE